MPYLLVLLYFRLYLIYGSLDIFAVIKVYVAYVVFQRVFNALIHVDNHVKQLVYTTSAAEDGRHKRNAKQLSELVVVELVATCFKLIKHV